MGRTYPWLAKPAVPFLEGRGLRGFVVAEDDEEAGAVGDDVEAGGLGGRDSGGAFGAGLHPDVFDAGFDGFVNDLLGDGR